MNKSRKCKGVQTVFRNCITSSLLLALLTLLGLAVGASAGVSGAIFTTDSTCQKVNGNIYPSKDAVYLDGGPTKTGAAGLPDGQYYVMITIPSTGTVLGSSYPDTVTVSGGEFATCLQLSAFVYSASSSFTVHGYDNTLNSGGEYKVSVSTDPTFPNDGTKTDNFKVRAGATCDGGASSCIICPEPFTNCVTDFQNGCLGTVVTYADPIVVGGTLDHCDPASGSFFCLGTTTVTCYASPSSIGSCSFDVTVSNTGDCGGTSQGCIISGPNGGDLGCNPGTATIPTCASVGLSTTDTCSTDSYSCTQDTDTVVGCVHSRRIHASATACDGSRCTYDQTFTWSVATAPVFDDGSGCDGTTDLLCNPDSVPTCATATKPTAHNECGPVDVTCSQPNDDTVDGCHHSRTLVFTATACGLSTDCSLTYTWTVDTEKPTITCPASGVVVGDPPALATTYADFVTQGGSASDNCSTDFELVTHDQTTQYGCVTVITRTYAVKDACGNTSDSCTQTITKVPKSLITNTERCCFDCNISLTGPQFRLLFTPDVSHPGCYKLNASNPGQFYYNVFVTNTPGVDVSLTVTVPFPFITQGAVPIHEYDGLTAYVNSGPLDSTCPAPTCIIPGNDVSTAFINQNTATTVSCGPLSSGTAKTITVTGKIPASGVLMVAIHLDYGLKGCTGYNQNTTTPYPDAVNCGGSSVQIPGQSSYSFSVSGSQTDTYPLSSFNVFKKNPGVGGAGNHAVVADGVVVLEGVPGVPVVLSTASKIAASNTLATGSTDSDGWYILPYKYTGKATTLYVTMYPGKANQIQKSITIKANGYVQLDFTLP
jgi:hypothetical protein